MVTISILITYELFLLKPIKMKKRNFFKILFNFFKRKKRKTMIDYTNDLIVPADIPQIKKPLFENFNVKNFVIQLQSLFPKNWQLILKMLILETRHFKSKQFIYTGSAGMEAFRKQFPYGWNSAKNLWTVKKYAAPIGYHIFTDHANRKRSFLAFKNPIYFAMYLDKYIDKYGVGRWRSTNKDVAAKYLATVNKININNLT